jgi:hypothetical protein
MVKIVDRVQESNCTNNKTKSHRAKTYHKQTEGYFYSKSVFICPVYLGVLYAYMSLHCMYAWCPRRPERVLDPRRLELQMAASCYMGARNQIQVLWKRSQCSLLQSHLSSSTILIFIFIRGVYIREVVVWKIIKELWGKLKRKRQKSDREKII